VAEARLILGDALAALRTLESGSVDAVVTDPPYGQSNESYDKGVNPEVWEECYRVCKPNAALVGFAGSPTYHRIAGGIEAGGWRVRQMWAWVYRDGMITSAWPKDGFDRLAPAMDPICYATKGKFLLNLRREGQPWKAWIRRSESDLPYSGRAKLNRVHEAEGHYPRSLVADEGVESFQWFALSRGAFAQRVEKTGHPNQKPLALMRWLVDKMPEGATILDPFAGSGTTLVAAVQTGRNAIGVEIDSTYHAIAEKRIAEAQAAYPPFAGKVTG
jgi:site-specific DNA-methyltransferase (adenine-specific)